MKKILIMCLIIVLIFPIKILADGSIDVSKNDIYILKGESIPFNVGLKNAAGRIDIISSNADIVSVSDRSIFLDKDSKNIIVNGIKNGNTVIKVYAYDVSTYDYEDLTSKEYTINAYVYTKGDINGDNSITLIDVTTLLKRYLNNDITNDKDIKICDIDNNGYIGLNDIIGLLKMYLEV